MSRALERSFYARPAHVVAPELLNKVFVRGELAARIVEVEAYGGDDDPPSHGYRGKTARNAVMFGPPGHLYVYFTYGMHNCVNVVCGNDGQASAVLLRAMTPLSGIDVIASRRNGVARKLWMAGPARLCVALGIDRSIDGTDVVAEGEFKILDDATPGPVRVGNGPRVGVSSGVTTPWRWWDVDSENVSRGPRTFSAPAFDEDRK